MVRIVFSSQRVDERLAHHAPADLRFQHHAHLAGVGRGTGDLRSFDGLHQATAGRAQIHVRGNIAQVRFALVGAQQVLEDLVIHIEPAQFVVTPLGDGHPVETPAGADDVATTRWVGGAGAHIHHHDGFLVLSEYPAGDGGGQRLLDQLDIAFAEYLLTAHSVARNGAIVEAGGNGDDGAVDAGTEELAHLRLRHLP